MVKISRLPIFHRHLDANRLGLDDPVSADVNHADVLPHFGNGEPISIKVTAISPLGITQGGELCRNDHAAASVKITDLPILQEPDHPVGHFAKVLINGRDHIISLQINHAVQPVLLHAGIAFAKLPCVFHIEAKHPPSLSVLKHEVTHHIQRTNPAQYKAFKDYVMKAYYNNDPDAMNGEIKRRIALAKLNNVTLTRSEAMDEIVADATERFLTDRDAIDALVRENRTLGETILNAIRDVLRKVEAAMKGEKIGTGGAFLNANQLKQAEKMWVEALNGTLDTEVGVNSVAISEESGPVWSMKSMKLGKQEYRQVQSARMNKYAGMDETDIPRIDYVYARDQFYIVENFALDDFSAKSRINPEKKSDLINFLTEAIDNGDLENFAGDSKSLENLWSNERRRARDLRDSRRRGKGRGTSGLDAGTGESSEGKSRSGGGRETGESGLKQFSFKDSSDYAPTFYSNMEQVAEGVKQEKLGAASVVSMLRGKGVKAEEIKWSGIETWLEGKKSVTKQELLEFMRGNRIEIQEKMRDNKDNIVFKRLSPTTKGLFVDGELVQTYYSRFGDRGYVAEMDDPNNFFPEEYAVKQHAKKTTKWDGYKLDGGKDYREVEFVLPESSYGNGPMKAHWGSDAHGILAHARVQDFRAEGGKMLFIEEIQSDWHNEGHKKGYDITGERKADIRNKSADVYRVFNQSDVMKSVENRLWRSDYSGDVTQLISDLFDGNKDAYADVMSNIELTKKERAFIDKAIAEEAKRQEHISNAQKETGVPDAPFKENYHVPEWAKPTIEKLIAHGSLKGDSKGDLNLSYDMLRILVINDREGLYGK